MKAKDAMKVKSMHRTAKDAGQSLLELALVLPILLGLVIGIFEFGRAWNIRQVLTNTAREAARAAVVGTTEDSLNAIIDYRLLDAGLDPAEATRTYDAGTGFGSPVTITIQYPYTFQFLGPIVGFLGGSSGDYGTINLSTSSTMRRET